MKRHLVALLACCACLASCKSASRFLHRNDPVVIVDRVAAFDPKVPPTHKEIVRAVLQLQDVALGSDASCSGVGTDTRDVNIGDYLSGFLAEQNDPKGGNWLDISAVAAAAANGEPLWRSSVTVRHSDGDDVWGWGVQFDLRGADHTVVKGSVRCTGAG